MLNCMTENIVSERLLVGAVKPRKLLLSSAVEKAQKRNFGDDAVGGMVQCNAEKKKLNVRTVQSHWTGDAAVDGMSCT